MRRTMQKNRCPKCKNKISIQKTSWYCPYCGNSLDNQRKNLFPQVEKQNKYLIRKCSFIVIVILVISMLYGHIHEVCWQCSAERDRYLFTFFAPNYFITKTNLSKRVEKLLGEPCLHNYWHYDYSTSIFSHTDGFPQFYVPILFPSRPKPIDVIENFPKTEWSKAAMLAITDKNNLSRYTALLVIITTINKEENWEQWWQINSEVFEKTADLEDALRVAKKVIIKIHQASINEHYKYIYEDIENRIAEDIPSLNDWRQKNKE